MRKKLKIYLDTSVISGLFDSRSPEIMKWTQEFWKNFDRYEIYISDIVIAEIEAIPDLKLKEQMGHAIRNILRLEIDEEVETLSKEYLRYGAVPVRYGKDALHLAIAVVNHLEILVSWNYRHIVRRRTKEVVRMVNSLLNYPFIEIIAPPELSGGE